MSHHGDSPRARQHPQLDVCDLYVFQAADGGTVLIQTLSSSGPAGFDPRGQYAFHLDTDGDARPDLTFRATTFGPEGPAGQTLQVQLLHGSAGADPDAAGQTLAAGPAGTIISGPGGIRVWAGRAADPFYINPHVVSAVATAVQNGTPLDLRALAHSQPANLFADCDVNAIVLEVPGSLLKSGGLRTRFRRGHRTRAGHGGRIGCWATTVLRQNGTWLRIQRCGLPLVATIFLGQDGDLADAYNASEPSQDRGKYGPLISRLAAQAAAELGACADPQAHGAYVCDQICPGILWYQPGTPATFGFAQRNGRDLADPAAEVMLSIVVGRAIPLGIDAGSAARSRRSTFPYLSPPAGPGRSQT